MYPKKKKKVNFQQKMSLNSANLFYFEEKKIRVHSRGFDSCTGIFFVVLIKL